MKKIIVLILILNVGCDIATKKNTNQGQIKKCLLQNRNITKFEEEILNGKVKTLSETHYDYRKNQIDSMKLKFKIVYAFDELGLLTRRLGIGQDIHYTYNSDCQLIKSSICSEENGKEYANNEYFYKNGNLIKHTIRHNELDGYDATYYTYDNKGKLAEEIVVEEYGKSQNKNKIRHIKYQYDINGDCVLEEELSESDIVTVRITKKYLNHNLIESFTWRKFEGENVNIKDLYTYNKDSTLSLHTKIIYEYNSTNKIADITETKYSYKYDGEHRLSEKSELSYKKTTCYFTDFDDKGNWQRKIIDEDGKTRIILRKFEYFKE